MKTKLLTDLRQEAKNEIGVFYNKDADTYEVIHKDSLGGQHIAKYAVEKDFKKAKQICDEYRTKLILHRVRQMRFGYEDAREGRIY